MPTGTLDATGTVGWSPALDWDVTATLAGFDPGYFAAGWNGNVSGQLASKGKQREDGLFQGTLDIPRLNGRLRDRALDARGTFALDGNNGSGDLALSLGGSRVTAKGKVGDTLDIDAAFDPLNLADLLPDASGTLAGTVNLTAPAPRRTSMPTSAARTSAGTTGAPVRSACAGVCRGAAAKATSPCRAARSTSVPYWTVSA